MALPSLSVARRLASPQGIFFPGLAVFAYRDNGLGVPLGNRGVTLFGVIRTITADGFDAFLAWDLIEQIRQNLGIANPIRGDFNRPNFQGLGVYP